MSATLTMTSGTWIVWSSMTMAAITGGGIKVIRQRKIRGK